ncbi:MAG: 4a-hydroxytetrahydrobiopterin dehydratase [Polyangiaceae bacterium]|nr:4a-hydroxytetrahydrobiopterin dehydratase [Polyangiaceae bacterium]
MSLGEKRCVPCEGGVPALTPGQVDALSKQLPEWSVAPDGASLARTFRFESYHQVMAFVNAVAWVAHREDHHPDLEVHYDHVVVRYCTHAIGGLSENDFICAAKVSALV